MIIGQGPALTTGPHRTDLCRIGDIHKRTVYNLNMNNEVVDLTSILSEIHERKWVALSKDNKKVVDFDSNLMALDKRVNRSEVTFMKVPPSDVYLSF